MGVAGLTWLQVSALESMVTPGGRVALPTKFGVPLLAWLPLTAIAIGAGVTVVVPPT